MDWRNMYKKKSKLDRWKRFMDFVSCNRSLVDGLEKRKMYKKRVKWIDGSDLWILYHVIGAWSMDWRKMYKKREK